jgi:hypothetical protein
MKGRKPPIHALSGAIDIAPPPPPWLPNFGKAEWKWLVQGSGHCSLRYEL